jgi:NhaP-type Na+/H+ or K+/H+ antiporter
VLKSHRTTPEVAGMIWEEELMKDRRRREYTAYAWGCVTGVVTLAFSILFLSKLTGGTCL